MPNNDLHNLYPIHPAWCGITDPSLDEREDFKMEARSFSMFVCLAVIEGLMMVTTLIPPSAGLFAGILFGIWMWRHILSARAILQEKVIKNEKMLVSIGLNVLFFVLVSVSYLS